VKTLARIAFAALALALSAQAAAQSLTFHPVVGAVTDHSAVVYVRVTPAADVSVRFWSRADESDAQTVHGPAPAASHDYMSHVTLSGLSANTRYHFSVRLNGLAAATSSFRTFSPPGNTDIGFRAVVFTDSRVPSDVGDTEQDDPSLTTPYMRAVMLDPHVWLQIGDYSHFNPAVRPPVGAIENWWRNNRNAYLTSMYRPPLWNGWTVPLVHIDDDRDRGGNNANCTSWFITQPSIPAFLDYFPAYDRPDPHALYQKFSYGSLVDVFVLDTRTYRDPRTMPGPSRAMLGAVQKDWFLSAIQASAAVWKLVVTTVPWNPTVPKADAWLGYATERAELMQVLAAIPGVHVISGDLHSGGGQDDGTYAGLPELTVSHTNQPPQARCTGADDCGDWSHGIIQPAASSGGFASIDATADTLTVTNHDFFGRPLIRTRRTVSGPMVSQPLPPATYAIGISAPGFGAAWRVGASRNIVWSHDYGRGAEFSVDVSRGGGAWERLASNVKSAGPVSATFRWRVSGPATASALIRVCGSGATCKVSAPFTIEP
jgi:hypothetical protein